MDARHRNSASGNLPPALRLLDVECAGYRIKWRFEYRRDERRQLLVAYSTQTGRLDDVQVLDAAGIQPSVRLREALADRIAEELARARLARVLASVDRRDQIANLSTTRDTLGARP